jgi:hypothetical protein
MKESRTISEPEKKEKPSVPRIMGIVGFFLILLSLIVGMFFKEGGAISLGGETTLPQLMVYIGLALVGLGALSGLISVLASRMQGKQARVSATHEPLGMDVRRDESEAHHAA